MKTLQSKAIILKEYNFGEADKIFLIFTKERGKISCIAKGVRKSKSRMRGFLQLFTYSNIHLHKGRSMYTAIGGEIINSFPDVKNDLELYGYANYMAEILDSFLPAEEPNHELFILTITVFHLMKTMSPSHLTSIFLLKLLKITGFLPEIFACIKCGVKIDRTASFNINEGGLLCSECEDTLKENFVMPLKIIKIMQNLLTTNFNTANRLKVGYKEQLFIENVLYKYIEAILEKPINSMDFIINLREYKI